MKKYLLQHCLLFLIITFHFNVFAQTSSNELPNIIPPSPNAANLGKFIEIPVGTYTGIPQIDIPIWSIDQGKIKLPISLSYHAGGIKVSEIASSVGLGWSLNVGGVVTRTVLGSEDESVFGFLNVPLPVNPDYDTKNLYASGSLDGQPDMFYFNVPEHSGRFVFDETGMVRNIPKQNIKINKLEVQRVAFNYGSVSGSVDCIPGWKIVTEDGIIYKFEDYEITASATVPGLNNKYSINTWNLTEIDSPTGDTLTFHYDNINQSYDLPFSERSYILKVPPTGGSGSGKYIKTGEINHLRQYLLIKRLSYIKFRNGKIRFVPCLKGRADLIGDNALEKIVIEDLSGEIIKQFHLNYNYLIGNTLQTYNSITFDGQNNFFNDSYVNYPEPFKRRLLLSSVIEENKNNEALNNGYQFDYIHDLGLPNRGYTLTDHWGYSNQSEVINPAIIPDFRRIRSSGNTQYIILGKDPDSAHAVQGILKGIKYPTGGYSSFSYELNECKYNNLLPYPLRQKMGQSVTIDYRHYDRNEYPYTVIGSQNYYYTEFTIDDNSGTADIDISTTINITYGGTPVLKDNINMYFYLININDPNTHIWTSSKINGTSTIRDLQNGTYRLYHFPYAPFIGDSNYEIYCNALINPWYETYAVTTYKMGGLRIRDIVNNDPVANKYVTNKYLYKNDVGESSGEILSGILYMHDYEEEFREEIDLGSGNSTIAIYNLLYKVYSSNLVYPLCTTQGRYVGYNMVTEQTVDRNNKPLGKTIYRYRSPYSAPDAYPLGNASFDHNQFPFPPADNRDWLRGQLLFKGDYKLMGNSYDSVKLVTNNYFVDDVVNLYKVSKGVKYDYSKKSNISGQSNLFGEVGYDIYSGFIFPMSTISEEKTSSGIFKTRSNFDYSLESLLPVRTITYKSDGSKIHNYITYPLEYLDNTGFIRKLVDNNIVNVPIENVTAKEDQNGNISIFSGVLSKYEDNNLGLIDEVLQLETTTPIPKNSFQFSSKVLGNLPPNGDKTVFTPDALYKSKVKFDQYDTKGNVQQVHKMNDINITYLWGYNNTYPVAKIEGADYVSVNNIIDQTILNTPPSEVALRNELNKIRVSLPNAMITSYTYQPLIGMRSSTGPDGVTIYYEYDSFGKLKYIKNNIGDIIKAFDYHYSIMAQP
jgi:hypothetical protein